MSLPTEAEQNEILKWQDEQSNMRITDKIFKAMSQAEERILKENVRPLAERVAQHDNIFTELGKSLSAGFGNITATVGRLTGKKS
jgi:hypothetical protein